MITKVTLENFKGITSQDFEFTRFDLLVGSNNCGKSTILQAMAIWQYCIDEFRRAKRKGKTGIQVVLPNFSALPVPEFVLLWKDKTERKYPKGQKSQIYILIKIVITWRNADLIEREFGVDLRYATPQSIYAIPAQGWNQFQKLDKEQLLPRIAYVPPFSGLEPFEEWRDISVIRKQVGKAQPGSVLRNLLYLVSAEGAQSSSWVEIETMINKWFSVQLQLPRYDKGVDTQITCEYKDRGKNFDIIAAGSGFHQTLTLLAFLYGFKPTTLLLDEPDAHLHVNLQRQILDYFKKKSNEQDIQFIIATHAEEFVKGVDLNQTVSLLAGEPSRKSPTSAILTAMADISNYEISQLRNSAFILYVEGETDERILRAWADILGKSTIINRFCFHPMGGGSKIDMKNAMERHFAAVRQIIPHAKQLMIFDYDTRETAFHPRDDNPAIFEWPRKNIENYLLVPEAWYRATLNQLRVADDLLGAPIYQIINGFFSSQNLTLPKDQTWKNLYADIFKQVDGKSILFTDDDSLFLKLRNSTYAPNIIREIVAGSMHIDEIHQDIMKLFSKLELIVADS